MSNLINKKLKINKRLLCEKLGQKIKPLRGKKGINLFAAEYDLSGTTLGQIERGVSDPKFTTLWRIAEAHGVPLWKIVKEIQEELPEKFSFIDK
ncbi:MAG: helix-turn-helix transcriptional regulator [Candidatus Gastranaerophilales bacterium]|nr:helix-turn-helix transcriptional regulator [Candidatus Gastranaerophilales bacterium]